MCVVADAGGDMGEEGVEQARFADPRLADDRNQFARRDVEVERAEQESRSWDRLAEALDREEHGKIGHPGSVKESRAACNTFLRLAGA